MKRWCLTSIIVFLFMTAYDNARCAQRLDEDYVLNSALRAYLEQGVAAQEALVFFLPVSMEWVVVTCDAPTSSFGEYVVNNTNLKLFQRNLLIRIFDESSTVTIVNSKAPNPPSEESLRKLKSRLPRAEYPLNVVWDDVRQVWCIYSCSESISGLPISLVTYAEYNPTTGVTSNIAYKK